MRSWIERQRNVVDFTLSSLLRRRRKNTALWLAYTLVVFLLASVMFFVHALKREASFVLEDAPQLVIQRIVAGRHEQIPADYIDRVKGIPGISSVEGRLWGTYYDPISGANYTLMVSGARGAPAGTIAIGEGVSRARLAYVGDVLEFRTFDGSLLELEVESLLAGHSALLTSDLILVGEADFRRLFGTPQGFLTDIACEVGNPRELPTIAVKVAEILPDTRQILRDDLMRTYDAVFSWRGGLLTVILGGALLAFVIFAWDKASGLSAEEKREIGILKAIGWETSDVILMKFWEGLVVSLTSFLAGILLGYAHVFFTSAALFEPVLKGWSVLYPRFDLVPFIDATQVVSLLFLTVVPYTVATIIPSWRAAIVDPDSVMR